MHIFATPEGIARRRRGVHTSFCKKHADVRAGSPGTPRRRRAAVAWCNCDRCTTCRGMCMESNVNIRETRRTVGHIAARLAEIGLDEVADPRVGKVKWKLREVLTACLVGMAAGCRGLGEVEEVTATLGRGARKHLQLWRRLPDTTARDLLCKLDPNQLRMRLHASVRIAKRRKQLPLELPISAVSMDGKGTSTWLFDPTDAHDKYGQLQGERATVRTVTSCWVSVPGRPCLDAYRQDDPRAEHRKPILHQQPAT